MSSCPTTRYCHSYVICQYNSHRTERFWCSTCSPRSGKIEGTIGVTAGHRVKKQSQRGACSIISEEIYVRAQSFLRKIETGIAGTPRASVRQRVGEKDLRSSLATGVGPVDG